MAVGVATGGAVSKVLAGVDAGEGVGVNSDGSLLVPAEGSDGVAEGAFEECEVMIAAATTAMALTTAAVTVLSLSDGIWLEIR